ncbi:MAG: Sensor histidine kinase YpdA [Bacteroidetes bacterium ADurb.Bin408]|nr:MAG: Sensor histidine kinase YpdA [Bacteroidetes bacterium ADurb.Bin408]
MLRTAELNFLKSQINPHFLFNSLNSISALTLSEPEKAREMIIKLSDFLRHVVSQPENKPVPLSYEIENIKRYLEIEKVRFGSKLEFVFDILADCADRLISVLLLQTLYENAVKHGVYESVEPITINTTVTLVNDFVEFKISNNFEPFVAGKKGAGIGISNIRERLRLLFNNTDLLAISKKDNIFEVLLKIPRQ